MMNFQPRSQGQAKEKTLGTRLDEFRHDFVKVAVDPRGYSQVHPQTT